MLKSGLCDYSDAYILVKGTITVNNIAADADGNNTDKKVIFKNCAPFTDCIPIGNNEAKYVEIMVPLKYLSSFWRTMEMSLINCEINLILAWSANCVMISTNNANQNSTFAITKTRPVVTLSTQGNTKLIKNHYSN